MIYMLLVGIDYFCITSHGDLSMRGKHDQLQAQVDTILVLQEEK